MGEQPAPDDSDVWQDVLSVVRQAAEADGTVDEQEMVIVEQITSLIAKLRAGRAKERDAALGTSPAMKHLSRSSGV